MRAPPQRRAVERAETVRRAVRRRRRRRVRRRHHARRQAAANAGGRRRRRRSASGPIISVIIARASSSASCDDASRWRWSGRSSEVSPGGLKRPRTRIVTPVVRRISSCVSRFVSAALFDDWLMSMSSASVPVAGWVTVAPAGGAPPGSATPPSGGSSPAPPPAPQRPQRPQRPGRRAAVVAVVVALALPGPTAPGRAATESAPSRWRQRRRCAGTSLGGGGGGGAASAAAGPSSHLRRLRAGAGSIAGILRASARRRRTRRARGGGDAGVPGASASAQPRRFFGWRSAADARRRPERHVNGEYEARSAEDVSADIDDSDNERSSRQLRAALAISRRAQAAASCATHACCVGKLPTVR